MQRSQTHKPKTHKPTMPYTPPFSLTSKILSSVAEISEAIGSASLDALQNSPELCRQNRIKAITGTLAIEGNTLNFEQVLAIASGKSVRGSELEVAEVQGAIRAYDALEQYRPHNIDDLLQAHKLMTHNILPDAGQFRNKGVGIFSGKDIIHIAPPAKRVPQLMQDLLHWLKRTESHPLISSCVFHYEFEFIHPFNDGNGRIGRLWQTLILGKWRKNFYNLPIENIIKAQQQSYYRALANANDESDSTKFIEFMLDIIFTSISAINQKSDQATEQVTEQAIDYVSDQVTVQVSEATK